MSIEGVRFTSRARNQLAFVRDSIDAGYLDDIHRFEVVERTMSTSSPNVGASTVTVMPRTSLSRVICVSPSEPPSATAAMVCLFRKSSPKATSA